jgi:hypothetical protein
MEKSKEKRESRIKRLRFPHNEQSSFERIGRVDSGPGSYYGPSVNSCTCVCSCW